MVFGVVIAEPDVTLTDWALALEAFVLAVLAWSHGRAWATFFGSIGVAALLGGITHGFFPDERGLAGTLLWRATLMAVGSTFVAAVVAGSRVLAPRLAARARAGAVVLGVAYALTVIAVSDAFAVAVIAYLPATLFVLGVFGADAWRTGGRRPLMGAAGIGVLLLGSWIQWGAIGALGLTHNALFHVIEMVALPLIYQGVREAPVREARRC